MARRKRDSETPIEQDSFLDIVANLVGILIILIVVVGSQIGEALVKVDSQEVAEAKTELQQLTDESERAEHETLLRTGDHQQWEQSLQDETVLAERRKLERDLILKQLLTIEGQLELEKKRLSEEQTEAFELQKAIDESNSALKKLNQTIAAIQYQQVERTRETDLEIIEHYPTPIAKTVFGDEVHFHLKDNRLVYAPLNELVQRLRATWETHAKDIPPGQSMVETIGPIGDFRLQYELTCNQKSIPTAQGAFLRTVVSLAGFSLLPTRQTLGEPVQQALSEDSEFHSTLRKYAPQRTTVSVWVHPDSYESFLDLRKSLIEKGYRVAVWPLTGDQHISGSPDGMRSSAQ